MLKLLDNLVLCREWRMKETYSRFKRELCSNIFQNVIFKILSKSILMTMHIFVIAFEFLEIIELKCIKVRECVITVKNCKNQIHSKLRRFN